MLVTQQEHTETGKITIFSYKEPFSLEESTFYQYQYDQQVEEESQYDSDEDVPPREDRVRFLIEESVVYSGSNLKLKHNIIHYISRQ